MSRVRIHMYVCMIVRHIYTYTHNRVVDVDIKIYIELRYCKCRCLQHKYVKRNSVYIMLVSRRYMDVTSEEIAVTW